MYIRGIINTLNSIGSGRDFERQQKDLDKRKSERHAGAAIIRARGLMSSRNHVAARFSLCHVDR